MRGLIFSDVMNPAADPVRYYEEILDGNKLQDCIHEQ